MADSPARLTVELALERLLEAVFEDFVDALLKPLRMLQGAEDRPRVSGPEQQRAASPRCSPLM